MREQIKRKAAEFLAAYYREGLAELIESGTNSLYIEFGDLYSFDADLAEDYIDHPEAFNEAFSAALLEVDVPYPLEEDEYKARVTDEEGYLDRRDPRDLNEENLDTFVAVEGQLSKITGLTFLVKEAVFECTKCGTYTEPVPQTRTRFQKPYECRGCERQGPFRFDTKRSNLTDLRKLKLETPPGKRAQGKGDSVTVYAEGDLTHIGGDHGLADRVGEQAVVLGRFHQDADEYGDRKRPELEGYLVAESFIFKKPAEEVVTVEETKDEFMALAAGEKGDPVDLLKQSIVPRIERTEQIDRVLEASVAWLFNAYRVEHDGEQIRGDLHMGIIGDPGTAKSTIMTGLAAIAPKCVFRSGGGGITKAGLTAAAVQEEFAGKTEWTLEPGILPRANGGHAILDEVDEIMGEKTKAMHDALEGEQLVKVDKAGISADLPTRCAVLIGGNPKDGRFEPFAPIAEQLDMDPAFISRLDVLLDVTDEPDSEHDRAIARTVLESEYGMTAEQVAETMGEHHPEQYRERPVSVEVFRDWVHYARENCFPLTTEESRRMIEELYLDVRNLNDAYEDHDREKPIPATPRVIESCIRLSKAFARVELSDTVQPRHVDRTRDILKASLKLNFDSEAGVFDADLTTEAVPRSQLSRMEAIKEIVGELDEGAEGVAVEQVVNTVAEDLGHDRSKVEYDIQKLLRRGDLYEPENGRVKYI